MEAAAGRRSVSVKGLDNESVVVTHVENPEKFFCRLNSNQNKFNELNELILRQVNDPFTQCPSLATIGPKHCLLAYSSIHQLWCRCRVVDHQKQPIDDKQVTTGAEDTKGNIKVDLVDFGSVEIVGKRDLLESTDEIIGFNVGQPFCFECKLCYVKPFSDSKEWSSYANYLFEKLTKDKIITLKFHDFSDGVVVCDLTSFAPKDTFHSMIDQLVFTRVARYRMGNDFYHRLFPNDGPDYDHKNPNPKDVEYISDDDNNESDLKNENKLYF